MKTHSLFVLFLLTTTNLFAGMVDNYGTGARATALGGAFCATADDPFAVYYNPAGLAGAGKKTIAAGLLVISPEMTVNNYTVTGGAALAKPELQTPGSFSNKTDHLISPHLGLVMPLTNNLTFGVAAYAPWGMAVEWNKAPAQNPGAYNSFRSYYMREVVTPSLGLRVSETLSIGCGISIGRSVTGNEYVSIGLSDARVKASLTDDFNHSFNLGVMYDPTEKITLGLTFRGRTEADFKGELDAQGIGTIADVKLGYDHPEQVQWGIRFVPDENRSLSFEVDMVWTNWSINTSQDQKITTRTDLSAYGLPASFTESVDRDWEDTTPIRVGAEWRALDYLTLRGGYYYDPSPVPDTTMDFIWPDGDKQTVSAGVGIELGHFTVDMAMAYSKTIADRKIAGESSSLNGSYGNEANPALAEFTADGSVLAGGVTVSYTF